MVTEGYSKLCRRNPQGTLAEWLTRWPAKPIPSGACVRITQVSHFHSLFDFLISFGNFVDVSEFLPVLVAFEEWGRSRDKVVTAQFSLSLLTY